MSSPLRIVRLEAENFKRLRAVSITPAGNVVQVTGANGSGKSSVLDAIYAALGGKAAAPDVPIRLGEESATIKLDLGKIKVTRRFTEGGSSLIVESEEGARFQSPQTMLDKMLGALTFDPLEFTRMDAKTQRASLGKLVGVDAELKKIDTYRRTAFENRTLINRTIAKLEAQIDAIPAESVDPIDVGAVMAEIEACERDNRAIDARIAEARAFHAESNRLKDKARNLRDSAAIMLAEADEVDRQFNLRMAECEQWAPIEPKHDTAPLKDKIAEAQTVNARVERQRRRNELHLEWLNEKTRAGLETETIENCDRDKARLISQAPMPIEGLAFDEDAVLYNGLPFEQASGAQQLRVSVAIAMATNPQLRVLRVKDGSLLDETSMALLADIVREKDYQLWIERVDTSGSVGIVMEDGNVVPDPFADPEEERTFQSEHARNMAEANG